MQYNFPVFVFQGDFCGIMVCTSKEPTVCEVLKMMRVSYKKLWVMLAEREMSKVELRKLAGIAPATFTKLSKNQEVALSILMKIADVLDCDAGDIMSFVKEDTASKTNK